ncbi:carbamoyl phosphate synthase large subunit [Anopheles sinensis]|uniref:Carbamoyl phosphate synthase large subunit n=1 Tax=Anopheles sinensis TaxID=74873 RepID=A0A084WFC7_ANOSI|nr:carbamoyl phosphate synthase large subunit [Anopheles sinensis]
MTTATATTTMKALLREKVGLGCAINYRFPGGVHRCENSFPSRRHCILPPSASGSRSIDKFVVPRAQWRPERAAAAASFVRFHHFAFRICCVVATRRNRNLLNLPTGRDNRFIRRRSTLARNELNLRLRRKGHRALLKKEIEPDERLATGLGTTEIIQSAAAYARVKLHELTEGSLKGLQQPPVRGAVK